MKKHVQWKTAQLAAEKGFDLLEECDSGYNPYTGDPIEEGWAWIRKVIPEQAHPRPQQWLLQQWLRDEFNIQIDMFYEAGGYSGRVFRLGDPERRWQSCTTKDYVGTLEAMLAMGLEMIDIEVEEFDKEKVWAACIKEALEHE